MIIIVDDNDSFRGALAALFRVEGHQALARPAPRFVDLDRLGNAPELLITDLELLGENGFEFADRFHARFPEVPVAMTTANLSPIVAREARRRTWMQLFHKPVDFHALLPLVATHPALVGGVAPAAA